MATYANGTPDWVDIGSPDMDATAAFYGALFGWTTTEPGPVEETGGYRMFLKDGKMVAGLGPAQEGMPTVWTTYLAADDADKSAELVKANGGAVFMEPFDVMDAGRMAIFADPTGAVFGVWQAGQHTGAEVKGEAGSIVWSELMTRDVEAAKTFYAEAFGLQPSPFPGAGGQEYTILSVGEEGVGGILQMDADFPPEVPNNWTTIFGSDDTDATMAKATSLGGSVMLAAFDIDQVGRVGYLVGPHGETFGVLTGVPSAE
jgi:predicted enzyme related to lactoylglutathione lyase